MSGGFDGDRSDFRGERNERTEVEERGADSDALEGSGGFILGDLDLCAGGRSD